MKVAIIGSRGWKSERMVREYIDRLRHAKMKTPLVVLTGGARGADTWAEKTCHALGITCVVHRPANMGYGEGARDRAIRAYFARNDRILEEADALVAFWDGKSKGTKYMIEGAKKKGIQLRVFLPTPSAKERTLPLFPETPF